MEIAGIGTQVVECVRVRRLIDRHEEAFLVRVYTPAELAFCRDRAKSTEHYAAVWAAKEAVFRSLGTTWRPGTAWTEIEVAGLGTGEMTANVNGPTQAFLTARRATSVLVTTAHCRTFATATAIAVRG